MQRKRGGPAASPFFLRPVPESGKIGSVREGEAPAEPRGALMIDSENDR